MKSGKLSRKNELHPPWQGTMLAWLSVIETVLLLMVFLFLFKLTYEGFKAGEMGSMIGIFGIMRNKPCATVFVRPTRFTFEFINRHNSFTLSAFNRSFKDDLSLPGTISGQISFYYVSRKKA